MLFCFEVLKNIENEWNRKHNQKRDITISPVNLFYFYFDIL